jgi:hypothetical protein
MIYLLSRIKNSKMNYLGINYKYYVEFSVNSLKSLAFALSI